MVTVEGGYCAIITRRAVDMSRKREIWEMPFLPTNRLPT